ncbi:uncharacterized protein LOC134024799 isoform X2 [Osmerus eperlanus]|uniref:uncharacterized protein LOC134024799 isoform X1 n=1 Tax=Osmerus eperlanus TaxID=29151 RepID=UPI002E11CBE9
MAANLFIIVKTEDDEERPCTDICHGGEEENKPILDTRRSINTQTQDNPSFRTRNIEENKVIWQRRSTQVNEIFSKVMTKKYRLQKHIKCKKIGLDVDVGSGLKQKLDLQLLTNGVMNEIADFAKELSTNSQKHYIAEILECNFEISFENIKQKGEFAYQTWQRVVELQKRHAQKPFKLSMLNQPWMLGLKPYYMVPKTSSQKDPLRDSEIITSEHLGYAEICSESESDMMANQDIKRETFYTVPEETRADLYPLCQEIGLDLDVTYKGWSKEKLDMDVLTKGVMIEVAKYTKKLCGTYKQIVLDILEHNFDLALQTVDSELFKTIFFNIGLLKQLRKKKISQPWYDTVFSMQRPRHVLKLASAVSKKKRLQKAVSRRQSDRLKMRQLSAAADIEELKKKQSGEARYETAVSLQRPRKRDRKLAPAVSRRKSERLKRRRLSAADGHKKKRKKGTRRERMSDRTCEMSNFERTDPYTYETADVDQIEDRGYMCSLENPGLEPSLTVLCAAGGGHVSSPAPPLTPSYDTHTALCAEEVKLENNENTRARVDYYPFCEQLGIDLDIHSKLESKEKHDLQFLTNGVMYEIHRYVNRNRNGLPYSHFLYDILDYNFRMSFTFHNYCYNFALQCTPRVKQLAKKYPRALLRNPHYAICMFVLHSEKMTEKNENKYSYSTARTSERHFERADL